MSEDEDGDLTVGHLAQQVAKEAGVPLEKQRLIFKGERKVIYFLSIYAEHSHILHRGHVGRLPRAPMNGHYWELNPSPCNECDWV